MFLALLERTIDPTEIDRLFERTTTRQYTREILFSSIVQLMGSVVCGVHPLIRAAYLDSLGEIAASLTAVYEELKGIEPGVCRGFVTDCAGRLRGLVQRLEMTAPQPVAGYRAKSSTATTWPGPSIARRRSVPPAPRPCPGKPWRSWTWPPLRRCRPLRGRLHPGACPDRSGPARGRAAGPVDRRSQPVHDAVDLRRARAGGSFLVRQHQSTLYWSEVTPWEAVGRAESGMVHEQMIRAEDPSGGGALELRRIRLDLDRPSAGEGDDPLLADGSAATAGRSGAAVPDLSAALRWRTSSRR